MNSNRFTAGAITVALLAVLALAGCSGGESTPKVGTMAPSDSSAATPTAVEQSGAERGTRANPLAIGEVRQIAEDSMWTVGAEGPTQVHDGFAVLPLRLNLNWEIAQANVDEEASGTSVEDTGADPWQSLTIEYVTAAGKSYNTMDSYADVDNMLFDVGTLYPPAESVSANVAVSVPAAEVPGGVWVVKNYGGYSVFLASE
jgi:hypothetical protein